MQILCSGGGGSGGLFSVEVCEVCDVNCRLISRCLWRESSHLLGDGNVLALSTSTSFPAQEDPNKFKCLIQSDLHDKTKKYISFQNAVISHSRCS